MGELKLNTVRKRRLYITTKILPFLATKPKGYIEFHFIPGYEGLWFTDDSKIYISYTCAPIPTLIHECVHALNPRLCESKVLRLESQLVKVLTETQAELFLDLIQKLRVPSTYGKKNTRSSNTNRDRKAG